jgi:hypothetical protein
MRRAVSSRWGALLAAALALLPVAVRAEQGENLDLDHINVQYLGGPLLQQVRVVTIFWGPSWRQDEQQRQLADYFNAFFQDLFADGRYMATLAQYSAGGYQIGNGRYVATATDESQVPARVTDFQIQTEIRAQIQAGALPPPEDDTLYFVMTPPGVVVVDGDGSDSEHDFAGYHSYSVSFSDSYQFPYAVIPYWDNPPSDQGISTGDPRLMTDVMSHELAEAVTDPYTSLSPAWYDLRNGEISDIPVYLYAYQRIGSHDLWDVLEGTAGRHYLVQKNWSVRDNKPIAFTPVAHVARE